MLLSVSSAVVILGPSSKSRLARPVEWDHGGFLFCLGPRDEQNIHPQPRSRAAAINSNFLPFSPIRTNDGLVSIGLKLISDSMTTN